MHHMRRLVPLAAQRHRAIDTGSPFPPARAAPAAPSPPPRRRPPRSCRSASPQATGTDPSPDTPRAGATSPTNECITPGSGPLLLEVRRAASAARPARRRGNGSPPPSPPAGSAPGGGRSSLPAAETACRSSGDRGPSRRGPHHAPVRPARRQPRPRPVARPRRPGWDECRPWRRAADRPATPEPRRRALECRRGRGDRDVAQHAGGRGARPARPAGHWRTARRRGARACR